MCCDDNPIFSYLSNIFCVRTSNYVFTRCSPGWPFKFNAVDKEEVTAGIIFSTKAGLKWVTSYHLIESR